MCLSFARHFKNRRQQGQCGVDRRTAPVDVPRPTRVAALGGVPIAAVAAGAGHSAAVSRDGAAYAWGCGLDGALGAGLAQAGDPLLSRRSRRRRSSPAALAASPGRRLSGGSSSDGCGGSGCAGGVGDGPGGGSAAAAGLGASSSVPLLLEGPGLDDEAVVQVGAML